MTAEEKDELFYRDTESIAFPQLDDHQLAQLESLGVRQTIRAGEIIVKAGQREFPMALVISGELEVFENRDGVEQILANPKPRDFVGEVSMLTGTSSLASYRGKAEESEVLLVPADKLRWALAELPGVQVGLPPGGMYAFLRVHGQDDSLAFAKRLVTEVGLGLAPGAAFGPEAEGWLRWCFASRDPQRLDEGIKRLSRAIGL